MFSLFALFFALPLFVHRNTGSATIGRTSLLESNSNSASIAVKKVLLAFKDFYANYYTA